MSVSSVPGAKMAITNLTVNDFKSAFAQTTSGEFKSSIDGTKGVLYFKGGRICSANIHGGIGRVKSEVTNQEIRQRLYNAFQRGRASDAFLAKVHDALLGDNVVGKSLKRKDVKGFIKEFEVEQANAVERQMTDVVSGKNPEAKLSLDDFRALAKGSGDDKDKKGAAYNQALRLRFFEVVKEKAEDVKKEALSQKARSVLLDWMEGQAYRRLDDISDNMQLLVDRLSLTLCSEDNLKKPLTSDEIARTLKALDNRMSYVPPKALAVREIHVFKASGDKKAFAKICAGYKKDVVELESFLSAFGVALKTPAAKTLYRLSHLLQEMHDIGRNVLDQKVVDVDYAQQKIGNLVKDFFKANPDMKNTRQVLSALVGEPTKINSKKELHELLRKVLNKKSMEDIIDNDGVFTGINTNNDYKFDADVPMFLLYCKDLLPIFTKLNSLQS